MAFYNALTLCLVLCEFICVSVPILLKECAAVESYAIFFSKCLDFIPNCVSSFYTYEMIIKHHISSYFFYIALRFKLEGNTSPF